jgi:hypothetical protein
VAQPNGVYGGGGGGYDGCGHVNDNYGDNHNGTDDCRDDYDDYGGLILLYTLLLPHHTFTYYLAKRFV